MIGHAGYGEWQDKMRIGSGYDVHRLIQNRKLIIGGVEIPYEKGLLGHSDADVLLHAIMDALLGAAALGDIGLHFPDNDPKYEGASSIELTKKVREILDEHMFYIENIDATVIAQAPKMRPYIDEMRGNIADALDIDISQVSVKATTEEGLGFTGNGEGIAAQAVCILESPSDLSAPDITQGMCGEKEIPECIVTGCGTPECGATGKADEKQTFRCSSCPRCSQ